MMQKQTYSNLNHLTEFEIDELIKRYYGHERIKDLLEAYSLNVKPGQLLQLFPPKETQSVCPYCEITMIQHFESRAHSTYDGGKIVCPDCGHNISTFECRCNNCKRVERERKQKERDNKYESVKSILDKSNKSEITPEELTFVEKVYLGTLFRTGLSEDFKIINPLDSFYLPLAPTHKYSLEILELLMHRKIIGISPESNLNLFSDIDEETPTLSCITEGVKWILLLNVDEEEKKSLVESLMNPNYEELPEEAYELWQRIALNECLEYFYHNLRNVLDIEYNAGSKTISIFTEMLQNLSVSQIFGIIYRATNNALRFRAERGVSRKHAANAVIGNAQNFAERALINNWNLSKYNRPRECPQSALSRFLYDRVLKIGIDGFHLPPKRNSGDSKIS